MLCRSSIKITCAPYVSDFPCRAIDQCVCTSSRGDFNGFFRRLFPGLLAQFDNSMPCQVIQGQANRQCIIWLGGLEGDSRGQVGGGKCFFGVCGVGVT